MDFRKSKKQFYALRTDSSDGMWISKLRITNSRSHRGIIQNAMHSLSCLEPFQQLAVITTSTHLARMLISDEVNFCILFKRLRAHSCIRFKTDLKGYYNQISNEAMFSIFQFWPHFSGKWLRSFQEVKKWWWKSKFMNYDNMGTKLKNRKHCFIRYLVIESFEVNFESYAYTYTYTSIRGLF